MTPKAVANAIEVRLGITGAPCQLIDIIEQVFLDGGFSAAAAAEQVDQIKKKVAAEINKRRDDRNEAGEIATIYTRGENDEIIYGSSYVFSDDSDEIKQSKLNRVFVSEIQEFIRGLSFSQFESLGRCVLNELGCKTANITTHTGDQGIDFYGELTVGGLLGTDKAILKLMHETRMIIVGQAKHYPTLKIGPNIVRELVGSLSLARTYTFSKEKIDLLNDVQLRPFSPVLALLFSTGSFTKGAQNLAKRAGLIVFSGWQLAVFLADRGVGLVNEKGSRKFDQDAFIAWLKR